MNAINELPPQLSTTLIATDAVRTMIRGGDDAHTVAIATDIDTPEMAVIANDQLKDVKARLIKAKEIREEFLAPLRQLIETTDKYLGPAIQAYEGAETLLKTKLMTWTKSENERVATENRAREAAQRKAREEADARAAAERARAAEVARQKEEQARAEARARERAEAEAREAAAARRRALEDGDREAARRAADTERKANEEAQRRAANEAKANEQALSAISQGDAKANEFTLSVSASTGIAVAPTQKLKGFHTAKNWKARLKPGVTEEQAIKAIVEAFATHPEYLALLALEWKAIHKQAKSLEHLFNIPGMESFNDERAASRAA